MLKIQRFLIVILALSFMDCVALARTLSRAVPKRTQAYHSPRTRRIALSVRNLDCTEDQVKMHLYRLYSNFVDSKPRVNRMVEASSGEGACIISAAFVKTANGELRYFPRSGPRADRRYAISFRKFEDLMTQFRRRYRLLDKEIVVADNTPANPQVLQPGSVQMMRPNGQIVHAMPSSGSTGIVIPSGGNLAAPLNGQIATVRDGR